MKNSLKIKHLFALSIITFFAASCNKEGQGGTSNITGTLMGIDHEAEVTQITFTNGNAVEHGDYFTLNSPDTDQFFYIWYDNPTWTSNGDPGLANRIGISVNFNYSDSNLDIAQNTAAAITNATSMFTLETLNDVVILTHVVSGASPDAEDVSSPFSIDILNQGKNSLTLPASPLVDERIYIEYGESTIANNDARTVGDGKFQFTSLQKGNYRIYTASKDTLNGGDILIARDVTIADKKSIIDLGTITVVY
jgi:hypothetical protein